MADALFGSLQLTVEFLQTCPDRVFTTLKEIQIPVAEKQITAENAFRKLLLPNQCRGTIQPFARFTLCFAGGGREVLDFLPEVPHAIRKLGLALRQFFQSGLEI